MCKAICIPIGRQLVFCGCSVYYPLWSWLSLILPYIGARVFSWDGIACGKTQSHYGIVWKLKTTDCSVIVFLNWNSMQTWLRDERVYSGALRQGSQQESEQTRGQTCYRWARGLILRNVIRECLFKCDFLSVETKPFNITKPSPRDVPTPEKVT